jgi:hypothetical protein
MCSMVRAPARNVHVSRGGDLAGHDADAGGDQHLAGHAAGRIVRQDGVQYGVRNLVGDLVGMAFGDGFRRKDSGFRVGA